MTTTDPSALPRSAPIRERRGQLERAPRRCHAAEPFYVPINDVFGADVLGLPFNPRLHDALPGLADQPQPAPGVDRAAPRCSAPCRSPTGSQRSERPSATAPSEPPPGAGSPG